MNKTKNKITKNVNRGNDIRVVNLKITRIFQRKIQIQKIYGRMEYISVRVGELLLKII